MRRIYKLTPVSLYDIRGVESWLEDMAKRGFFLKKLRPAFSTFERGPARPVRYRVEPDRQRQDAELPQDMLDLYREFGWTLVCMPQDTLIFFNPDPEAPELHSDPELQGELWKKLYRVKLRGFWISLLLDLALMACAWAGLFQNGTPVLNFLTTDVLILTIAILFLLAMLPSSWADLRLLALVVQQLGEGRPLDHRVPYLRRRSWGSFLLNLLLPILILGVLLTNQFIPLSGKTRTLDELTGFPLLSLAQVEGNGFQPSVLYTPNMGASIRQVIDYGNFCYQEHYLLCQSYWRAVQSGEIGPDVWVRMEVERYDLPSWLSLLSAPLARELMERTMRLDGDIWWTDHSSAVWTAEYFPCGEGGFLAVARRSDGFHIAAAAVGDKAVLVRYTGHGDLASHLDEIVKMAQSR